MSAIPGSDPCSCHEDLARSWSRPRGVCVSACAYALGEGRHKEGCSERKPGDTSQRTGLLAVDGWTSGWTPLFQIPVP